MTDYKKWENIEREIEDDPEDLARERLRAQKEDMSADEVQRLHDCWEKPDFKRMFHEYAEEVSDPAHKAEQEEYLAQCEAEQRMERDAKDGFLNGRSPAEAGLSVNPLTGQIDTLSNAVPGAPEAPEGSQLLKPNKGFVVKTWKKAPGKSEYDRELGKVFLNVCAHDEIDAPSSQEVETPDGRKGQSWSLPHLVSPAAKEERDKSGHMSTVYDVVFNTEVLRRVEAPHGVGERWKEMVAKTAVEMCAKLHELQLDPEFKTLKMRYFGGAGAGPSTLSWKPGRSFNEPAVEAHGGAAGAVKAAAKGDANKGGALSGGGAAKPAAAPKPSAAAAAAAGPAKPAAAAAKVKPAPSAGLAGALASPPPAAAKPSGPREPAHTVVHRGVGDLASSWNDSNLSSSGRPRELLVKVELPELRSAAEIDLDITERKLELSHEGCGYQLSLSLAYAVLSEQGSAKFDKAKRLLTITLPVVAELEPMTQWAPAEAAGEIAISEADERAEKAAAKAAAAAEGAAAAAARDAACKARERAAAAEELGRQATRAAAVAQAEREAARRSAKEGGAAPKPKPKPKPKGAPPSAMAAAPKPKPPTAATGAAVIAAVSAATGAPPGAPSSKQRDTDEARDEWVVVDGKDGKADSKPGSAEEPAAGSAAAPALAPAPAAERSGFSNALLFELD